MHTKPTANSTCNGFRETSYYSVFIVILLIAGLNACSNAVEGTSAPSNPITKADTTAPTWTVTPDNNSLLPATDSITIVFSEPMDINSLTVSNELSNEMAEALWSTTNDENDTLALSPNSAWSDGLQRSLSIEAKDKAGNAAVPILLSYDVDTKAPRVTADPSYTLSNTPLTVTLSCDDGQGTGCAAIYYTVDGTIPTTNSLLYIDPVSIDQTTKFKYIGVDNAGVVSNYTSGWYTIDMTPPTGAVTPTPNQIIGSHDDIEVRFSETMDVDSLLLSGTLAPEVGVIEWATVNVSNDHLILHPVSGSNWNLGINATLTIAALDLAGNALEDELGATDISLAYDIGTIHVNIDDVNAADSNPGTRALPLPTIQSAITKASLLPGPSQVLVAQGTYIASNLTFSAVNLVEQVSLFGGYAPDWSSRNPATYSSTITAGKITVAPTYVSIDGLSWVVSAFGGITASTIVDGFVIDGGSGSNPVGPVSAVYITGGANPLIRRNTISGGNVDGKVYGVYIDNARSNINLNTINGTLQPSAAPVATDSTAVYITNGANPTIQKNYIDGGSAITSAMGIHLENASASIKKNDINGGNANIVYGINSVNSPMNAYNNLLINFDAPRVSYGISSSAGSTTRIYNNIVDPGALSTNPFGIFLQEGSAPDIKNNILTNGVCINEADITSDPLFVENNDFFNCQIAYVDADSSCINDLDGDGLFDTCNIEELNSLADMTTANNLSDDPVFQDPANGDYHLSLTSPPSIVEGGFDLSAFCTCDRDDTTRTVPWSIGPYELDP